jgi:polyvinyl alcohol dehydrogenase (cytochrome)
MKATRIWICGAMLVLGACSAELSSAGSDGQSAIAELKSDTKDWTMAGYDVLGSFNNREEKQVGKKNVHELEVKWRFDETTAGEPVGPIHATPMVKGNKIYVGSSLGRFYALDRDGQLLWQYVTRPPSALQAALGIGTPVGGQTGANTAPIFGAAVLPKTRNVVIFGDINGNLYALDRETGAEVWVKPDYDGHGLGGIVGNSLLLIDDTTVVIGFSSIENNALVLGSLLPGGYPCCSNTGLVVALDVRTGAEKWRYETLPAAGVAPLPPQFAPYVRGPSGADVWGQPTYDADTKTVYIGTGQNFSPDANGGTPASDSIVAIDATTGARKWATQLTSGDLWLTGIPNPNNGVWVDQDFGDSPKIYRLADGTKVVGAGQKSGAYHVLDAATGQVLYSTQHIQQASSLGGFQNGGGFSGDRVYVHGLHGLNAQGTAGFNGVMMALSLDGTQVHWRFDRFAAAFAGCSAIANGVVYLVNPIEESPPRSGPQQFALYAFDDQTGAVLARYPFAGRALSSPVVSRGRVLVPHGNTAIVQLGADPSGGLIALGLPGDD